MTPDTPRPVDCTCTPSPDVGGQCAWCDVHGLPSAAWAQGVAEGVNSERDISEIQIRDLRTKMAAMRADRDRADRAWSRALDEVEKADAREGRVTAELKEVRAELACLRAGRASGATVGDCGNASPANGLGGKLCGIKSHCTLPFGHDGWHRDDVTKSRWGKSWSDPANEDGHPSIPLDALKAIAQGEPLDEVAGDYGVPLDIVRAAAPSVGRRDDTTYNACWGPDVDQSEAGGFEDHPGSCPGCRTVAPASHAQGCSHAPDGALDLLRRLVTNHYGAGDLRVNEQLMGKACALLGGRS